MRRRRRQEKREPTRQAAAAVLPRGRRAQVAVSGNLTLSRARRFLPLFERDVASGAPRGPGSLGIYRVRCEEGALPRGVGGEKGEGVVDSLIARVVACVCVRDAAGENVKVSPRS